MNLDALTFGQLLEMGSTARLCTVTREYHTALREAWERLPLLSFSVASAAVGFPGIAAEYAPEIAFITSPKLKRALRLSAEKQTVPYIPGGRVRIRTCEFYSPEEEKDAYGLAVIVKTFCERCGVPAWIQKTGCFYLVFVETNEFGAQVLRYRPGCTVGSLRTFCEDGGFSFRDIFWWCPNGATEFHRLNPIPRCLNTPDITENAKEILFEPQTSPAASAGPADNSRPRLDMACACVS